MEIIINGIPRKSMAKGAFGNKLTCPALVAGIDGQPEMCGAEAWSFVESIGPYRIRYRCKVCHKTVVYDFSNNPGHPYEVYAKSKWQRIVDQWRNSKKGSASLGR